MWARLFISQRPSSAEPLISFVVINLTQNVAILQPATYTTALYNQVGVSEINEPQSN